MFVSEDDRVVARMKGKSALRDRISRDWTGEILWNQSMSRFTTLRVGGPAFGLAKPKTLDELLALIELLREIGVTWRVVGRGSNLLVADEGYPGVVILLGEHFSRIELRGEEAGAVKVRAEAGCSLSRLLNWSADQGLAGLEFAVGIPGSVGGALAMNAGAWGREISQVAASVEIVDQAGLVSSWQREELSFSYRRLEIRADEILLAGTFRLFRSEMRMIRKTCQEILAQRRQRQPQRVMSAGSFFKNPSGQAAGRLIEEAGLKGHQVGGAMVSEQHANFIVNAGGASARDIFRLMELIQDRVRDRTGISLEPEVHVLV